MVATLRYGESFSSHSTIASSIGIFSGSVWNWTQKSNVASPWLKWSRMLSSR